MSHNVLLVSLMLVAGGMAAAQSAMNARLSGLLGSPVQASFVSFCVGAATLLVVLAILREGPPSPARLAGVPPGYLLGGLCGVAFITTAIFLVPRIGVVNVLFAGLAGQALVSVLIDHHGLFGLERHPINVWKAAGLALICLGVVLLKREVQPVRVAVPEAPSERSGPASAPLSTPPAPLVARRPVAGRARRRDEVRRVKERIRAIGRERAARALEGRPAPSDAAHAPRLTRRPRSPAPGTPAGPDPRTAPLPPPTSASRTRRARAPRR